MAWRAAVNLPFVPTGTLDFSPIIGADVYLIDHSTNNFWRYGLGSRIYTQLANPPFTGQNIPRVLHLRNNRLYMVDEGGGALPTGRRISWYDITTGIWASSSQAPFAVYRNMRSLCFADDDTIWVWFVNDAGIRLKCTRYVISTDTWTEFANDTGVLAMAIAYSAAINAAGTIVYTSGMGAGAGWYGRYTIATDAYAQVANLGAINWGYVADPLRLWYHPTAGLQTTWRYGYLLIADLTAYSNHWLANANRSNRWGHYGVANLNAIIDEASDVPPEIYHDGLIIPTVQTDPATGVI